MLSLSSKCRILGICYSTEEVATPCMELFLYEFPDPHLFGVDAKILMTWFETWYLTNKSEIEWIKVASRAEQCKNITDSLDFIESLQCFTWFSWVIITPIQFEAWAGHSLNFTKEMLDSGIMKISKDARFTVLFTSKPSSTALTTMFEPRVFANGWSTGKRIFWKATGNDQKDTIAKSKAILALLSRYILDKASLHQLIDDNMKAEEANLAITKVLDLHFPRHCSCTIDPSHFQMKLE